MTTLISVYNSDGCVGRCDAKCYSAGGKSCHCVCGGKNHGAGKNQAVENTRQLAGEWVGLYQIQHPEIREDLEWCIPDQQLELIPA